MLRVVWERVGENRVHVIRKTYQRWNSEENADKKEEAKYHRSASEYYEYIYLELNHEKCKNCNVKKNLPIIKKKEAIAFFSRIRH